MIKPIFDFDEEREAREISVHELRRYHAGELDDQRRAAIAARVETDAVLRAELDELEATERAFKATHSFERFLSDHEARRRQQSALSSLQSRLRRFRWQASGLIAAGAAALLLLVVLPRGETRTPRYGGLKGAARVGFFVREHDGARIGVDGEQLPPGAQIQFAVRDDPQSSSMVLLGIDGRGHVTTYVAMHLRDAGNEKGSASDKARLLPQSLVLDEALGPERFFVVYGKEEPDALQAEAERAAKALLERETDLTRADRLSLGEGHAQSSVHIVKVRP